MEPVEPIGKTAPDLATVAGLAPSIRAGIAEMERLCALPADLHRTLYDAGLFHMLLPTDVGGFDVPLPKALQIYEALAEVDASTAWTVVIGAGTAALGSMIEPGAVRESLWSQPVGVAVGTFVRSGKAALAGDEYRVSGRWAFSSGSVGADWYIAYCVAYDGDEPQLDEAGNQVVVALPVPMSECHIEPTWDSAGLRGTASNHVRIDSVVVPASYGFSLTGPANAGTPLHYVPLFALLDCSLAVVMTGVVRGAFEDVFELFGARASDKGGLETFPASVGLEFAQLLAEATAWRTAVFTAVGRLWESVERARQQETAPRSGLDGDFEVRLASKAAARRGPGIVSALSVMAGGRSLTEEPELQRRLRDAHAIASHFQYSTPPMAALGQEAVLRFASTPR